MATQSRSVLRQIWHWKSSSVLRSAVVYLEVAMRCGSQEHGLAPAVFDSVHACCPDTPQASGELRYNCLQSSMKTDHLKQSIKSCSTFRRVSLCMPKSD